METNHTEKNGTAEDGSRLKRDLEKLKNTIVAVSTASLIGTLLVGALVIGKVQESYALSMKSMCRSDMIAAEVSKLDKGIAVDLYKFTGGRSAEEMLSLPQCKDAKE